MPRLLLDPAAVRQLMEAGWTVMYGPDVISFHFDDRTILRFDDGRVDVDDRSDALSAPTLTDPIWCTALALLGINTEGLTFNPIVRGWTQPLGVAS